MLIERLQATRLRLLDVYGDDTSAERRACRRAAPRSASLRPSARDRTTRGRSSSSRSPATARAFAPGQFTMLYAFGVGEVPISISGDPAADRSCTPSARSGR